MLVFLRMKLLIFGLLLASPSLAAWAYLGGESLGVRGGAGKPVVKQEQAHFEGGTRISVEVLANGSAPQWVAVEVPPQAIPEPGVISLLAVMGALFTLRRRR